MPITNNFNDLSDGSPRKRLVAECLASLAPQCSNPELRPTLVHTSTVSHSAHILLTRSHLQRDQNSLQFILLRFYITIQKKNRTHSLTIQGACPTRKYKKRLSLIAHTPHTALARSPRLIIQLFFCLHYIHMFQHNASFFFTHQLRPPIHSQMRNTALS